MTNRKKTVNRTLNAFFEKIGLDSSKPSWNEPFIEIGPGRFVKVNFGNSLDTGGKTLYQVFLNFWEVPVNSDEAPFTVYHGKSLHTPYLAIEDLCLFIQRIRKMMVAARSPKEEEDIIDCYNRHLSYESGFFENRDNLEEYFDSRCRIAGWKSEKLSPTLLGRGVPDRKVTTGDGYVFYVRFLDPIEGESLTSSQERFTKELKSKGFEVSNVWSRAQADFIIQIPSNEVPALAERPC